MTRTLQNVLADEMMARNYLNELRDERERINALCQSALTELNELKREAYRMGFKGNIMRDADGNRVNTLRKVPS